MAQDMCPTSCATTNTLDSSNAYIVHHVSKLDTLAGVAIKYGVEVADVKRSNGLVTDFEMFAYRTLRIPLRQRHLVASSSAAKSENLSLPGCPLSSRKSTNYHIQLDGGKNQEKKARDKRPLSSAMSLLRGYYGLSPPAQQAGGGAVGMEMASYKQGAEEHSDDEPFSPMAAFLPVLKNGYRRSNGVHHSGSNGSEREGKSTAESNGPSSETQVVQIAGAGDAGNERSVRRRFKPDLATQPAEICGNVDGEQDTSILDRLLPGLGLLGGMESSTGLSVAILKVLDGALASSKAKESPLFKVRKSFSTSNLHDQSGPQVNGLKVEVKSGSQFIQGGTKASSDLPHKILNYRFKAALD